MAYVFCFFKQTKNLKHGDVSALICLNLARWSHYVTIVIIFVSAPGYSERGPSASSTCATPTLGTRAPSDAANRTQNVKVGKNIFF